MRIEPILQRQERAGACRYTRRRLPLTPIMKQTAQEISVTLDLATRHLMLLWCAVGDDETAAGHIAHALVGADAGRRLAASLIEGPDCLRRGGEVVARSANTSDGREIVESTSREASELSGTDRADRGPSDMSAVRGGC